MKWLFMCVVNIHASRSLHPAYHSYSDAICRYAIEKLARGTTSTNGDPKDQLRPIHDLEGPSVVFGRRSCPRDQGVAWGKASQPGKLTVA